MAGLKVRWIDHRGKTWHLTEGTEGVVLDLGQRGLGWSEISHVFTHGGLNHAAATVGRGTHALKVLVGYGRTGQAYYNVAHEWWALANSPFELGTLEVERPDGVVRSRRLRLAETPDTSYAFDPGIGQENGPELWELTGDGSWWYGVEQAVVFTYKNLSGANSTPFYGDRGAGWPLYIAAPGVARDAWISNKGQGPMWPTYTLVGPLTSPLIGVTDYGVLSYNGSVAAGEVVEINTDPTNRYVTEVGSGDNRYGFVTGKYVPIPVGDRVALTIQAEGMTSKSSITATGREAYARAF